jgi:hypothetical protein
MIKQNSRKEVRMTVLQMFRKGLLKPGGLVRCVRTVTNSAGLEIMKQGRPYRILRQTSPEHLVLRIEGGLPYPIYPPVPGKRSQTSWSALEPF